MPDLVDVQFVGGPMDGKILKAQMDPVTRRPPPRYATATYRKADPNKPPSKRDKEVAHHVYDINPNPDLDGPFWRATYRPGERATLPPRPNP